MSTLPTNYVDAVLNAEVNTRRRFNLIDNGDGTVSLEDVTDYTRVGSNYGAQDINNQNAEINQINSDLVELEGKIMRTLDFANAEVVAKNVPYTTIKDGVYLVSFSSSSSGDLTIDGVSIFSNTGTTTATTSVSFELPLKTGTVISNTLSGADSNKNYVSKFVPYDD